MMSTHPRSNHRAAVELAAVKERGKEQWQVYATQQEPLIRTPAVLVIAALVMAAGIALMLVSSLRPHAATTHASLKRACNLVSNSGFELSDGSGGAAHWAPISSDGGTEVSYLRDRSVSAAGKASLRLTRTGFLENGEVAGIQRLAKVPLSKRVILRGEIRTRDVTGRAILRLYFLDPDESRILSVVETRPVSGGSGWTEVSKSADIPAKAGSAFVAVVLSGTGEAWFDNVRVLANDVWHPDYPMAAENPGQTSGFRPQAPK